VLRRPWHYAAGGTGLPPTRTGCRRREPRDRTTLCPPQE
jgi:hypothetical protein